MAAKILTPFPPPFSQTVQLAEDLETWLAAAEGLPEGDRGFVETLLVTGARLADEERYGTVEELEREIHGDPEPPKPRRRCQLKPVLRPWQERRRQYLRETGRL